MLSSKAVNASIAQLVADCVSHTRLVLIAPRDASVKTTSPACRRPAGESRYARKSAKKLPLVPLGVAALKWASHESTVEPSMCGDAAAAATAASSLACVAASA